MSNETEKKTVDQKCDFVVVSAVKKLIKANDRQCSPSFLKALDAFISAKVRQACSVHNGGAKRLDETVLTAGTVQETKKTETKSDKIDLITQVKNIRQEIVCLELKVNSIEKAEYLRAIRKVKAACDEIIA